MVTILVILGVVAGRSVYLIRRDLGQLHEALTDAQQKRHYLEHTLTQQTRERRAWQQALEHLSDGIYQLDEQGQLLAVISNNPAKTPTYELHAYDLKASNPGLSLEALFPHKLVRDVHKLLEQTREQQAPQQHHYQHHLQYCEGATQPHTKHYQLQCLPIGSPSNKNHQANGIHSDDTLASLASGYLLIVRDISEQVALHASEQRSKAILAAIPDVIGRFSRQGRYLEVLHQGYYTPVTSPKDIIGKSIADVLPAEAAQRAVHHLQCVFAGSKLEIFEYDVLIHNEIHHREIYLVPFDEDSCIGIVHDITERKRAEHALSRALTEQTALLNEIHHRVKNNLQVIASLLTLHARATDEPAVKNALEANRKRVIAMATVHKLIYASGSLSDVAFHSYLHAIVPNLLPPYSMNRVQVNFALTPLSLPIDYAIPLGIITAELLENIFQHAFAELHQPSSQYPHATPEHHDSERQDSKHHDSERQASEYQDSEHQDFEFHNHETQAAPIPAEASPTAVVSSLPTVLPTVTIALEQHQHITLRVSDNGIGLPETFNSDNLSRHTSLGISVVDALVSQIGGSWCISRLQAGTQVEVSFMMEEMLE